MMSDDPLAGLLGSTRPKRKADITFGSRDKTETGLNPLDILALPAAQRDTINWLSRRKQATLDEIATAIKKSPSELTTALDELKQSGYIREALVNGQIYYRVIFGGKVSRTARGMPQTIWNAVDLDNTAFLKEQALFKHLGEAELRDIATKLESRHYHRNEVLIWQGDINQYTLFVKNGIVGITRLSPGSSEEGQILAYLNQGAMLGEINALMGQNIAATATVTALSEVSVLAMRNSDFMQYLQDHRRAALELSRVILNRVLATNARFEASTLDTKVAMVFAVGSHGGHTILGSALAMTLAHVAQSKSVYTEHPNSEPLAELYGCPPNATYHPQTGSFDIANIKTAPGLPKAVRTTLVMDQLTADYPNVVIGVPDYVDDSINYMLEQASQIVIVFSSEEPAIEKLKTLIHQLREFLHPEKTNLFVVAHHTSQNLSITDLPIRVDFEIPFLGEANPLTAQTLEELPPDLSKVTNLLADRLGRTNQVGIYIPAAEDDSTNYVPETLSFLGGLFGGATATTTETQSGSDEVVPEVIHVVRTYVTKADLDRHLSKVLTYIEQLKTKLGQEVMALEVNAKLMLI